MLMSVMHFSCLYQTVDTALKTQVDIMQMLVP